MLRITALLATVALAAALCGCTEQSADADVPEANSPIDLALVDAAEAGKSVLVEYVKDGCACCALMEKTLADTEVAEALERVVRVRLVKDADDGLFESRWVAEKTPAYVVLGPDGTQRGDVVTGPIEVGDFLFFLDWVAAGEGEQPEIQAVEDGCGGCGSKEEPAEALEGGCGGCGEE